MSKTKTISLLLVLSAINLTVMVPGGGIDTRNFSDISPALLSAFNIFLTTLGMVSLFLPYFVIRKYKWSLWAAFICGLSYFLVYALDFASIFPKSPDSMPKLLTILEALGIILSIPIMVLSIKEMRGLPENQGKIQLSNQAYWLIAFAVIIGVGIVIFATNSAMTGK